MSYLEAWLALLLLVMGSLEALLGGFEWGLATPIARLVGVGIAILILSGLAVRIIPISIHNWTASVIFPLATTGLNRRSFSSSCRYTLALFGRREMSGQTRIDEESL
jgi:hypothetical protein